MVFQPWAVSGLAAVSFGAQAVAIDYRQKLRSAGVSTGGGRVQRIIRGSWYAGVLLILIGLVVYWKMGYAYPNEPWDVLRYGTWTTTWSAAGWLVMASSKVVECVSLRHRLVDASISS
jgi:hypothetical protein